MSAVPKPVKPLPLPGSGPADRGPRRPGARPGAQTSDVRRRLQRDLDRREASLRVNRRVSGPVGGITRPEAPPAVAPVQRAAPAAAPRRETQRSAERPATVARSAQRPPTNRAVVAQPVPTRPAPQIRAYRIAPAAVAAPALKPAPRPVPRRQPLVTIDGGQAGKRSTRRRFSVGTVFVSAVVLVVITIGLIVALQIQKTQVNEQIGADLAQVSRQEQAVTQLREQISRQVAGAQIAGEISRRGLVEPDVSDVRYLKAGVRATTAERAAEALANAPVAGSAAAAAAAAAAGTGDVVTADQSQPATTGAAGETAMTGAVTAP